MSIKIERKANTNIRSELESRARLYRTIRAYFDEHQVLEVEPSLLAPHTVSDPHIHSFAVDGGYLQTSPEFGMKKLLSKGSGDIFSLGKAFRAAESGRQHRPEFMMLEWYRIGFGLKELEQDVQGLLGHILAAFDVPAIEFQSFLYRDLFETKFGINPHLASIESLRDLGQQHFPESIGHIDAKDEGEKNDWLDLLFSEGIEPDLHNLTFVSEFPASQSSLSKVESRNGFDVALRTELYWKGVELANGYDELLDSNELRQRIEGDNAIRKNRGYPAVDADEALLVAMDHMPASAGIALGVDRLLMILENKQSLSDVLFD